MLETFSVPYGYMQWQDLFKIFIKTLPLTVKVRICYSSLPPLVYEGLVRSVLTKIISAEYNAIEITAAKTNFSKKPSSFIRTDVFYKNMYVSKTKKNIEFCRNRRAGEVCGTGELRSVRCLNCVCCRKRSFVLNNLRNKGASHLFSSFLYTDHLYRLLWNDYKTLMNE